MELLVVIFIISVLIALLLPALSAAHQQALSVQCLSNLRQLGLGCTLYAADWNGAVPAYTTAYPNGTALKWYQQLPPYLDMNNLLTNWSNWYWHPIHGKGVNPGVLACPAPDDAGNAQGGYAYNLGFSPEFGPDNLYGNYGGNLPAPAPRLSDVVTPTHKIFFVDAQDWDINVWWDNVGWVNMENRHFGKANCVCVDGHAQGLPENVLSDSKIQEMNNSGQFWQANALIESWFDPTYTP